MVEDGGGGVSFLMVGSELNGSKAREQWSARDFLLLFSLPLSLYILLIIRVMPLLVFG